MSKIKLNGEQLQEIIGWGAHTRGEDLPPAIHDMVRQVGMFFANNLWLSEVAVYITNMTLTPSSGKDQPPAGVVEIDFMGLQTILVSDENRKVPIPPALKLLMKSMPKTFPSAQETLRFPKRKKTTRHKKRKRKRR